MWHKKLHLIGHTAACALRRLAAHPQARSTGIGWWHSSRNHSVGGLLQVGVLQVGCDARIKPESAFQAAFFTLIQRKGQSGGRTLCTFIGEPHLVGRAVPWTRKRAPPTPHNALLPGTTNKVHDQRLYK